MSMTWQEQALENWRVGYSWAMNVDALRGRFPGKSDSYVREKVRGYVRSTDEYIKANSVDKPQRESVAFNKDGSVTKSKVIRLKEGQELTPETLLEAHGFDKTKWTVRSCINNYYETQKKGGSVLTLYQSKLTAEPRKADDITLEEIREFFIGFESKYKPPAIKTPIRCNASLCAEVNISDPHIGKLGWAPEAGENYDFHIASQRWNDTVDDIVARLADKPIEKIWLPVGHDLLHVDNAVGTTTKGTPQNTDVRVQKMYQVAAKLVIDAIETLRTIAPVDAFYINSNHDSLLTYTLVCLLEAHFRGSKSVSVDCSPSFRKYREYGDTLVGFSHGDADKKALGGLMQVEAREAWGRTKYHEMHAAHIHKESESVFEDSGVILRRTSSFTGPDAWHAQQGYLGAVKKSTTYLYDKQRGLIETLYSVV